MLETCTYKKKTAKCDGQPFDRLTTCLRRCCGQQLSAKALLAAVYYAICAARHTTVCSVWQCVPVVPLREHSLWLFNNTIILAFSIIIVAHGPFRAKCFLSFVIPIAGWLDDDACLPAVRCPKCVTISMRAAPTTTTAAHRTCELEFLLLFVCPFFCSPSHHIATPWWSVCLLRQCVCVCCVNINFRYSLYLFRLLVRVPIGKWLRKMSADSTDFRLFLAPARRTCSLWKGLLLWISCKCNIVSGCCCCWSQARTAQPARSTHRQFQSKTATYISDRVFCQFSLGLHLALGATHEIETDVRLRLCGMPHAAWTVECCGMFNCVTGTYQKLVHFYLGRKEK